MLLYKKFAMILLIAFRIVFATNYLIAKLITIIIYQFSFNIFNKVLIKLIDYRSNDAILL